MSKELYQLVKATCFEDKICLGKALSSLLPREILPLSADDLESLKIPGRPSDFQIVPPRQVPSRRNLQNPQNRINFLYAIANIELLAIELPAFCLLRFGSVDLDFISQQLKIISEEALHFELLKNRLKEMGCEFGSLPVHHGLWDYAWRCQSELEHQILIPCYLEARGLDVTPEFIKNFLALGDEKTAAVLQIILDDEIGHVRMGLEYLKNKASELGKNPDEVFESVLSLFFNNKLKSKVMLNKEIRAKAGFSERQMRCLT